MKQKATPPEQPLVFCILTTSPPYNSRIGYVFAEGQFRFWRLFSLLYPIPQKNTTLVRHFGAVCILVHHCGASSKIRWLSWSHWTDAEDPQSIHYRCHQFDGTFDENFRILGVSRPMLSRPPTNFDEAPNLGVPKCTLHQKWSTKVVLLRARVRAPFPCSPWVINEMVRENLRTGTAVSVKKTGVNRIDGGGITVNNWYDIWHILYMYFINGMNLAALFLSNHEVHNTTFFFWYDPCVWQSKFMGGM